MKADFSRETFDAANHYSAVLYQQGRVLTDADFNESQAIAGHRAETTTAHLVGPAGSPKFDSIGGQSLPDGGFALSVDGAGQLVIGRGHYYVDGILCENPSDILYASGQPHLPTPPQIDASLPPGSTWLIYLDVFKRERTALDQPALREVSLGGPDTTARAQVIWQVHALPLGLTPVAGCTDQPAAWTELIAPRNPRMAVQTPPLSAADSPCDAPPAAGFVGPENQFYRVEVHSTNAAGSRAATRFKWSRENASVVARIERVGSATSGTVSGTLLGVHSTGRDSYLGFHKDDWVEYIDDSLELQQSAGTLVQIAAIDPQINEITLASAVSVRFDHNPKLRRWDQGTATTTRNGAPAAVPNTAAGVAMNANNATWLLLEHNIWVQFANDVYRPGDYWTFAARAATGSVDLPAGPQPAAGVQHHYALLGYVRLDAAGLPGLLFDCRPLFPPLTNICAEDVCYDNSDCDLNAATVQEALEALCRRGPGEGGGCLCTVTLGENGINDLQTAVDALPAEGGCICIPAGQFDQPQPVQIAGRRSITIKGCGTASVVTAEFDEPLFLIDDSSEITLHSFMARCPGAPFARLRNTGLPVDDEMTGLNRGVRIDDCAIACPQTAAVEVFGSHRNLIVENCRIGATQALTFAGYELDGLLVHRNHFVTLGDVALQFGKTEAFVNGQIEDNLIECPGFGLWFESLSGSAGLTIARNRIFAATNEGMAAIFVETLEAESQFTLTANSLGSAKAPAFRGLHVERLHSGSKLLIEENQVVATLEALRLLAAKDNPEETSVHASANTLTSAGIERTVVVGSNENADDPAPLAHLIFSNNQIRSRQEAQTCTVDLNARHIVAMGNYVADPGGEQGTSIRLPHEPFPDAATAIGNVTKNGINLEFIVTPNNVIVLNNATF